MSAELAAYGLVCSGAAALADHTLVTDALELARVVGVLDAWQDAATVPTGPEPLWHTVKLSGGRFGCNLNWGDNDRTYFGNSHDAARAAAAKAIEAGEV